MSFPAAGLTLPSLSTWQMSYGGLAFAGVTQGGTYQLQELPEGLDIPSYVTGDIQRGLDQGEFAGLDLAPGRNVIVKQIIGASTAAALDAARQQFAGVLSPKGSVEEPLYIQLASGLFACMARPRKHAFSAGVSDVFAHATTATTMWHATDPRWYQMPTSTLSCGLPEPAAGLTFPLTFPITWPATTTNSVTVNNNGYMEMRPLLTVSGPCTNPRITNSSLAGAPAVAFNITLNAGDTLVIDMDWQTVVYTSAGSQQGSSRRNAEKAGSVWWNCPPGSNVIQFSSSDASHVAGTLTVQSASAYMGL